MQSHTPVSKLHSVNEAIFTQLLMSKKEQFTRGNHAIYKKHLQKLLTYYEDWKIAQLERRKSGLPRKTWEPSFLAPETYRNMRIAISGCVHFTDYLLDYLPSRTEGIYYVPMQINNQTPLGGHFSVTRRSGKDNADMGTEIANQCSEQVLDACATSVYDVNDCIDLVDSKTSGLKLFTKFGRDTTKKG